ncbi:ZIP family zinc transporter [Salinibacter ruber]|uniref:hypothetical protein n=1 Tax=Salinibacter ruber TaxID=146919 RepID=UPI002168DEBE|nr:hypothetical protein [Salinibacter ruber]MCS4188909.1 ZIP family zinc transporter [Salinibacter ruber]
MSSRTSTRTPSPRAVRWTTGLIACGMGLVTAFGLVAGLMKLLAMGRRAETHVVGTVARRLRRLAWAYGLSSGAMITSAALFLVPNAVSHDVSLGGVGIALRIVGGFAIHTGLSPQASEGEAASIPVVWVLSMHSLGAGLVIGAVYATMPALGAVLGLAIVSHKGPAGYAAAVCIAAVPVGLIDPPTSDAFHAVVFGAATGLFLHVAIDFLPRCGWGSELYRAARVRPDSQSGPTARRVGNANQG